MAGDDERAALDELAQSIDQDQVARDVELLAELEREIETVWRPRLHEARTAAGRLYEASYAGAESVIDQIDQLEITAVTSDIRYMLEGQGDEFWLGVLQNAASMGSWNREAPLYAALREAGRDKVRSALEAMPLKAQVIVLKWLTPADAGSEFDMDQPPPQAAQLFSTVTGLTVEPGEPCHRPTPEETRETRALATALLASGKGS